MNTVTLWLFPESDHSAWIDLTWESLTYAEYRSIIERTKRELEQQGQTVRIITPSVEAFKREMKSANRAYLISVWR